VVEDEVIYDNVTPWPPITTGQSLNRASPTFFGNSSSAWIATAASPGTVAFPPGVTGDLTGDGAVDANDIDFLSATINHGTTVTAYDLDGNGTVDAADRVFLVDSVLGTFMGDANLDGRVDAVDLNTVGIHWQQTGDCLRWEQGNFDGNDVVDAGDLNALGVNWLSGAPAVPALRVPRAPLANHVQVVDAALAEIATDQRDTARAQSAPNHGDQPVDRERAPVRRSRWSRIARRRPANHASQDGIDAHTGLATSDLDAALDPVHRRHDKS
jgi:hypothetical protein